MGNLPANAADTGSIPGPGGSHNAQEQQGPGAVATKPVL